MPEPLSDKSAGILLSMFQDIYRQEVGHCRRRDRRARRYLPPRWAPAEFVRRRVRYQMKPGERLENLG